MRRIFMNAKIHRATVTDANLNYAGSLGIDTALLEAAGIAEHEQVHVVNVTNGERLVTYAIAAGPGEIVLNGAAARRGAAGDIVIIMTFAELEPYEVAAHRPTVVQVDARNRRI